jgi:hypothetical protein
MGKIAWKTTRLNAIEYVETYHPAAAMRFPSADEQSDFEGREVYSKQYPY